MMHPVMLPRRNLMAATAAAATALLGLCGAKLGRHPPSSDQAALAALCAALNCPDTLGKACRGALPPTDTSATALVAGLIADLPTAHGRILPPDALAQAVRRQSRDDFGSGRVVMVDGWMLSLTETRLYALASILPRHWVTPG